MGTELTDAEVKHIDEATPGMALAKPGAALKTLQNSIDWYREFIMPAPVAATPIEILSDEEVGPGKKVVITGWKVLTSAGVWGSNANELFFDSNDDVVRQLTLPISLFFTKTSIYLYIDSDQATVAIAYSETQGGPDGQGLKVLADANEGAAADLQIAVWGNIVDA